MKNRILIIEFLLVIVMFLNFNTLRSQTYYGKNDLGRLEFINDSIYVASFYNYNEMKFYDTGTYHKIGDTLFLNSKVKLPFVLEEVDREEGFTNGNDGNYLIKFFWKPPEAKGHYQMSIECFGRSIFYDSINNELKCPVSIYNNDVIVIFDGFIYKRFKAKTPYRGYNHYKIKITDDKWDRIYLDEFPLLIKKNKLIPIDKNKNEDCWVNNGFYFPSMIYRSKDYEPKHSKTIRVAVRGIIGFYPGYDH